jgi:hypothetical protein
LPQHLQGARAAKVLDHQASVARLKLRELGACHLVDASIKVNRL